MLWSDLIPHVAQLAAERALGTRTASCASLNQEAALGLSCWSLAFGAATTHLRLADHLPGRPGDGGGGGGGGGEGGGGGGGGGDGGTSRGGGRDNTITAIPTPAPGWVPTWSRRPEAQVATFIALLSVVPGPDAFELHYRPGLLRLGLEGDRYAAYRLATTLGGFRILHDRFRRSLAGEAQDRCPSWSSDLASDLRFGFVDTPELRPGPAGADGPGSGATEVGPAGASAGIATSDPPSPTGGGDIPAP